MDKRYRHLLRTTLAALPLACVALLSSCAFDDDAADGCPDPNAPATVRISVSAGEPGDLNGTRAGDDVNADKQEFMHTLYLCILDEQGYVQEMFHAEAGSLQNLIVSEPAAATGDIFNWTSDEFTLPVGTYTIYAFANVDGYIGENDQTQNVDVMGYLQDQFKMGMGGSVRTDLPSFRLNDPAGKINFNGGMFIPMSAKKTITITSNTRDISIGLDRLVSKVRITVPDNQYVSTNSTITFSGYSENVPLLGADNGGYGDAQLYGGTTTTDEIPFTQVGEDVSFYVNETPGGNPFTVTLNTGKSGNGDVSAYVAKTKRTDIPRNSIYPLSLTFPDFGFNLTPTAWLYVTGVPYAVYYSVEENAFKVEIATGSFFNLAPGNVTDGDGEHQATWTWTVPQYEGLNIQTNQDGVIEGNVPAGNEYIGYKYTLHLNGKWTDNAGHSFDRSYTVVVDVCHNEAWAIANRIQGGTTTRGAKAEAPVYMLAPENLNMFKMK